jgi:hypothetical protein
MAIVGQGRLRARAIMLDVAQPLGRRVGQRRALPTMPGSSARRACASTSSSHTSARRFVTPISSHDAAKESNLPSEGLPRPAGFEVPALQGFCVSYGRLSSPQCS